MNPHTIPPPHLYSTPQVAKGRSKLHFYSGESMREFRVISLTKTMALLLAMTCPQGAIADFTQSVVMGDFTFSVDLDAKTALVNKLDNASGAVVFPDAIRYKDDIYTVTHLSCSYHSGWYNNPDITSIHLPSGLTHCGSFAGCVNLSTITGGPDVLQGVGPCVLSDTKWLKEQPAGLVTWKGWVVGSNGQLQTDTLRLREGLVGIAPLSIASRKPRPEFRCVVIPQSMVNLDYTDLNHSDRLERIMVHPDNPVYLSDAAGALYQRDQTREYTLSGGHTRSVTGNMLLTFPRGGKLRHHRVMEGTAIMQADAYGHARHCRQVTLPEGFRLVHGYSNAKNELRIVDFPSTLECVNNGISPELPVLVMRSPEVALLDGKHFAKQFRGTVLYVPREAMARYKATGPYYDKRKFAEIRAIEDGIAGYSDLWIGGLQLTRYDDAPVSYPGMAQGTVSYDYAARTLTLSGVVASSDIVSDVEGLDIILQGENRLDRIGALILSANTTFRCAADGRLSLVSLPIVAEPNPGQKVAPPSISFEDCHIFAPHDMMLGEVMRGDAMASDLVINGLKIPASEFTGLNSQDSKISGSRSRGLQTHNLGTYGSESYVLNSRNSKSFGTESCGLNTQESGFSGSEFSALNSQDSELSGSEPNGVMSYFVITPDTKLGLSVGGKEVTERNYKRLSSFPGISSGALTYNPETRTLVLDHIVYRGKAELVKSSVEGLTIVVRDFNLVEHSKVGVSHTFVLDGPTTFRGEQDGGVCANSVTQMIEASADVTIEDCTLAGTRCNFIGDEESRLTIRNSYLLARKNYYLPITGWGEVVLDDCYVHKPFEYIVRDGTIRWVSGRPPLQVEILPGTNPEPIVVGESKPKPFAGVPTGILPYVHDICAYFNEMGCTPASVLDCLRTTCDGDWHFTKADVHSGKQDPEYNGLLVCYCHKNALYYFSALKNSYKKRRRMFYFC